MSLVFVPTREPTAFQKSVIDKAEKVFTDAGFRNIAADGYYQWTKEILNVRHKKGLLKTIEINIDIYHHGKIKPIRRKYQPRMWFGPFQWFPKTSYTKRSIRVQKELRVAANELQWALGKIVDYTHEPYGIDPFGTEYARADYPKELLPIADRVQVIGVPKINKKEEQL